MKTLKALKNTLIYDFAVFWPLMAVAAFGSVQYAEYASNALNLISGLIIISSLLLVAAIAIPDVIEKAAEAKIKESSRSDLEFDVIATRRYGIPSTLIEALACAALGFYFLASFKVFSVLVYSAYSGKLLEITAAPERSTN